MKTLNEKQIKHISGGLLACGCEPFGYKTVNTNKECRNFCCNEKKSLSFTTVETDPDYGIIIPSTGVVSHHEEYCFPLIGTV